MATALSCDSDQLKNILFEHFPYQSITKLILPITLSTKLDNDQELAQFCNLQRKYVKIDVTAVFS